MQKENPVIKNYILSSKKRILIEEDTPLRSNNLHPSPAFVRFSIASPTTAPSPTRGEGEVLFYHWNFEMS